MTRHFHEKNAACILTLGVGQEAVERRDVAWARGDSDGVVLSDAVSLGNTCTPREMMESGICASKKKRRTVSLEAAGERLRCKLAPQSAAER